MKHSTADSDLLLTSVCDTVTNQQSILASRIFFFTGETSCHCKRRSISCSVCPATPHCQRAHCEDVRTVFFLKPSTNVNCIKLNAAKLAKTRSAFANCSARKRVVNMQTRNAWQSLAYRPLGTAYSPLASSSKPKPGYHLANVQTMHVVSVCLHCGNII